MKPKEKAKELLNKMLSKNPNIQDGISIIDTIQAKGCVLIAVDEILNIDYIKPYILHKEIIKYFAEVKQEIEKL